MFAHLYVCQSETNTIRNRVLALDEPLHMGYHLTWLPRPIGGTWPARRG